MSVLVPISIGELYDKHSILEIKLEKIKDVEKREWVQKEYDMLTPLIESNPISDILKKKIKSINSELWNIEECIRKKDRNLEFDDDFIIMARNVYQYNDERSLIKQQINIDTNSILRDIKSYI
jgi:hypothetical protein